MNAIDIAQNMTGLVPLWIAAVVANAFILRRLRGRSKLLFRRAFIAATFGPPAVMIASALFVQLLFPTVAIVASVLAFMAGVPLEVLTVASGLFLLRVKRGETRT